MGKFDLYKIALKGQAAKAETYNFNLDNTFFGDIDGDEFQKGKVAVTLDVNRAVDSYSLVFTFEGMVQVLCDRCLDDMDLIVSGKELVHVRFGTDTSASDDVIVLPAEDQDINIAWILYEFIALTIPMKHVHQPGKCNKGMISSLKKHLKEPTDQDSESEEDELSKEKGSSSSENPTDPRWDELKKITDNN